MKYDSYRNSSLMWIKELPTHWEIIRSKRLFNQRKEQSNKEDVHLTASQKYGIIPQTEFMEREGRKVTQVVLNNEILKHIEKNDFVISMRSFQGGIEHSSYSGSVSSAYIPLIPVKHVYPNFFKFLFKSASYIKALSSTSDLVRDGQAMRFSNFCQIDLFIVPEKEQIAIADFLDDNTAKIDQAIALKEKLIELLKERKQIITNDAVTKGLDPNVRMKDSGIDGMAPIPKNWTVKKLKFVFELSKGLTITKENLKDDGIYCVNYGEIHSKYGFEVNPDIHDLKCVEEEYLKTCPNSILEKGDFVFADTSEDIEGSGNFTYLNSNKKIFAGYHTVIAKPKIKIQSRFFAYLFDSVSFRNQIRIRVKGVKVYSITQTILKQPSIWLPSDIEQTQIVQYLDRQCAQLDQSISLHQTQIQKLKEYKTTLIDSAVTGKIKVC